MYYQVLLSGTYCYSSISGCQDDENLIRTVTSIYQRISPTPLFKTLENLRNFSFQFIVTICFYYYKGIIGIRSIDLFDSRTGIVKEYNFFQILEEIIFSAILINIFLYREKIHWLSQDAAMNCRWTSVISFEYAIGMSMRCNSVENIINAWINVQSVVRRKKRL